MPLRFMDGLWFFKLFMIVKWFIVADGLWLLHGFCLLMVSVYGWLMVADGFCLRMVYGS